MDQVFSQGVSTTLVPDNQIVDYGNLLAKRGIAFTNWDYYYQVGQVDLVQGWVLYVSVVRSQLWAALETVLPMLIDHGVGFRVVQNIEAARLVLDGHAGMVQVGKVIIVYPENDAQAVSVASALVALSKAFKGPDVPTAAFLGGCVYARYGAIAGVRATNAGGTYETYIYDPAGNLIKDIEEVPFRLPHGVSWPFGTIREFSSAPIYKLIAGRYKPLLALQFQPKGVVLKAIRIKGLFRFLTCVLKQGSAYAWSDDHGRDIKDRLLWQQQVYESLKGIVRMPQVYEFFEWNGSSYLSMEFVRGRTLQAEINALNPQSASWSSLDAAIQRKIVGYLLQMVEFVESIHRAGFVHRDITPFNFMVDKKGRLWLIDCEMAYSLKAATPDPPYGLGTAGFMSAEQLRYDRPTVQEDIYAVGATMLSVFTGLLPGFLCPMPAAELKSRLLFFTSSTLLADLIGDCLQEQPEKRPTIGGIRQLLQNYEKSKAVAYRNGLSAGAGQINEVLASALRGLVRPPTPMMNNLWMVKEEGVTGPSGPAQATYAAYGGLVGIGGVMYVISRAAEAGYAVKDCEPAYESGWRFIQQNMLEIPDRVAPGLYGGLAGVALTVISGIKSGLLKKREGVEAMAKCFSDRYAGLNIANGCAGMGLSLLQCTDFLREKREDALLQEYEEVLLKSYDEILCQSLQQNGHWIMEVSSAGKPVADMRWDSGDTGIIWYLLHRAGCCHVPNLSRIADRLLPSILKQADQYRQLFSRKGYTAVLEPASSEGNRLLEFCRVLLKAYQNDQRPEYHRAVTELLETLPGCIVHTNFSQYNGLAGIGELYLEAHGVLGDERWRQQAAWIADLFCNTRKQVEDYCFWSTGDGRNVSAGFFTGNSGIIHFLLRYARPGIKFPFT
ncbi:hypothetical protein EGT74_06455 [Chitinophaga lutea]|uniref:non-specific serine/threonine protein kinase n=1 Tax=Chitinophaga lutea TaxID=2488634 RepID=A0A3N4PYY3_9BACT|nr:protein kinase [Chitinophaga lutea]RPE13168.1 hypothetical protein EGT74_06455 [Chitinophaga lutea]